MELRKDYLLDRWVIISSVRKKRPNEFKKEKLVQKNGVCFFCSGNEHLTPAEIGRVGENGKWKIRWFANKFPFVEQKGSPITITKGTFFTSSPAYGKHEVIAETPEHEKQLWDLPETHIKKILEVYKERINSLSSEKNIKYVVVFKNHGADAGTSLVHSHTQVVAINKVPPIIKEEVLASKKFKACPYCDIIKLESKSRRKCFENPNFIAFTPYASRFGFELWIFPKKHVKDMNGLDDKALSDLAKILKKALLKLKEINASYNLFLHLAPKSEDLHFHIEITPRLGLWGGFEFGTDIIINSVMPEDAAEFYRE